MASFRRCAQADLVTEWLVQVAAILATLVGAEDADDRCLDLGRLDALRVEALAGDPRSLGRVHAGEAGRRADADVVAAYRERGLELRGAAMHRLECTVREEDATSVVLDVVEALGPTWVVDDRDRWRLLPTSAPASRRITLIRTGEGWRVAGVQ